MDSYKNVRDTMAAASEQLAAYEKAVDGFAFSAKKSAEYAQLLHDIDVTKTYIKILKDNARRAFVAETLPAILDIVNKYSGKAYGEKRKEAICAACKDAVRCAVYLHDGGTYGSDELTIVPLNKDGFTEWFFSYNDLKLTVKRNGNEKGRLFDGNKVIAKTVEDFGLYWCNEYDETPLHTACAIVEKFAEVRKLYDTFEEACREYNKMIPSSMENINANNPRYRMF